MSPWLSVIVPVYNGERYLEHALESVARQGDEDIEVIAVDDGSSDGSLEILRSFAGRLPLRILHPGRSGNWVAATNAGLAEARGTYICMLHQDDAWLPGRLERVKEAIRRADGPDLVVSDARFIDRHGAPLGTWTCPLPSGELLRPDEVLKRLLVQNFIALPSAIFRRQTALSAGGLDETLWYTADWDLWLKIAASGRTFYIPSTLAAFRVHEESQTATRSSRAGDFRAQLETVLNRHLPLWRAGQKESSEVDQVERVAWFSVEVNVASAALSHGSPRQAARLALPFFALGLRGWRRYLTDSRIAERLGSRVRSRLRVQLRPDEAAPLRPVA